MSKFFQSLNKENGVKSGKNQESRWLLLSNLTIWFLVVIMIVFNIVQTNFMIVDSYKIDGLKKQVTELGAEKQQLELQSIELRSISDLENKVVNLEMVKVDQLVHISRVDSTVALR